MLVAAKCPECGATLKVNSNKKTTECEYCGTIFAIEDAVNHFNASYFSTINNITNSVVYIQDHQKKGFRIEIGVLRKYNGESTDVLIPEGVKRIGERAFAGLPITSVIMPSSIEYVEAEAFLDCTSLVMVEFSNNIVDIECYAFKNCRSLLNLILPKSLKRIWYSAFENCISLNSIDFSISLGLIGDNAFQNCTALSKISLPKTIYAINKNAFSQCPSLEEVVMDNEVYEKLKLFDAINLEHIFKATPYLHKNELYKEYLLEQEKIKEEEKQRLEELLLVHEKEQEEYNRLLEEEKEKKIIEDWKKQGLCKYCGGKLSLRGKCKVCKEQNWVENPIF